MTFPFWKTTQSTLMAAAVLALMGLEAGAAGYQLTPSELDLDCKKLSGRMQVRILQIRDFDRQKRTSELARGIQSVITPIYGGTGRGSDPGGQQARDIAILEAYNARLTELKCKSFDLKRWLNSTNANDLPGATISPPKQ